MLGNQQILLKLKQYRLAACPTATKDVPTNLKNRQKCIDDANYGPLNPNEPNEDYWKKKADMFGGDLVSAIHERGEIFTETYLPEGTSIHALVDGSLAKIIENLK